LNGNPRIFRKHRSINPERQNRACLSFMIPSIVYEFDLNLNDSLKRNCY